MADLSLNAFGLVMILLTFCVLLSNSSMGQSTQRPKARNQSEERRIETLRAEIERLRGEHEQKSASAEFDGLWKFQIHVTQLVGPNGWIQKSNAELEYFTWLRFDGNRVRGTLFGVESRDHTSGYVASFADISGSRDGEHITMELSFTGDAAPGSEILRLRQVGDELVGRLASGRTKQNFQNFEGQAVGRRMTDSDLQE